MTKLQNELFSVDTEGAVLKSLICPGDAYAMNWIEGADSLGYGKGSRRYIRRNR